MKRIENMTRCEGQCKRVGTGSKKSDDSRCVRADSPGSAHVTVHVSVRAQPSVHACRERKLNHIHARITRNIILSYLKIMIFFFLSAVQL